MTYRVISNPATGPATPASFALANESGDLARTTEGSIYLARKLEHAQEAMTYLNSAPPGFRPGSHRMQSMFGK